MVSEITLKQYDTILNDVKKYIYYKNQGFFFNIYDIAHSVIIDDDFKISNYKHLIIREIYKEIQLLKPLCKIEVLEVENEVVYELFKQCPKCLELLLESQFYNLILCQKCYREKNKEKIALAQRKFKQKPENKKKDLEYQKNRHKNLSPEQKEKLKIYKANWYQQNKNKL